MTAHRKGMSVYIFFHILFLFQYLLFLVIYSFFRLVMSRRDIPFSISYFHVFFKQVLLQIFPLVVFSDRRGKTGCITNKKKKGK